MDGLVHLADHCRIQCSTGRAGGPMSLELSTECLKHTHWIPCNEFVLLCCTAFIWDTFETNASHVFAVGDVDIVDT